MFHGEGVPIFHYREKSLQVDWLRRDNFAKSDQPQVPTAVNKRPASEVPFLHMSSSSSVPEIINPIYPEYIPRLTKEFINLYNENAATKLASHQVPIEEVFPQAKFDQRILIVNTVASSPMEIFLCIRCRPDSGSSSDDRLFCSCSSRWASTNSGI
jgi:hypothetical protein